MGRVLSEAGRKRQLRALSARHKEICRRLTLGEKHQDIAEDLGVSRETISIVHGSSLGQAYMQRLQGDIRSDEGALVLPRPSRRVSPRPGPREHR